MRKLVLAALVLIGSVAACKPAGSAKLEGRWRGTKADGAPTGTQLAADTFAQGTEIVVHGSQITITTPPGKSAIAGYTVDREDKTTVVIHTDKDTPAETFSFTDDTTMLWRVDEKQSIVFKRVAK